MMSRFFPVAFFAVFAGAGLLSTAAAQDEGGPAGMRTWTSRDGKYATRAVLTGFKAGKVILQKEGGATIGVPLIELSDEDQAHVRQTADDDPEAVEGLSKQKVELDRDQQGRVIQAIFPQNRRFSRQDVELLSGLPNLERLGLARARVSEGAFDAIENLPNLRQLDLTATTVGNAEVKQLESLKNLEALNLSYTRITNRGLSYLKGLPELRKLALANTRIGDEGIRHLEELESLEALNLRNVRVSRQGILRLRKALPNAAMEGSGVVPR